MNASDIHLSDINRILFGTAPVEFLLEIVYRALIVYAALLVVVKLLGKRMSGQLTITEMAVMLTLGAIIAVPVQIPDKGILQGIELLFLFLVMQRGLTLWSYKNQNIEKLLQGKPSILVKDGVLNLDELRRSKVSHQQLFSIIREHQIYNLGEVKRAYLETTGDFSIYRNEKPKPGLSTLPEMDHGILLDQQKSDVEVCGNCGALKPSGEAHECEVCHHKEEWNVAVY